MGTYWGKVKKGAQRGRDLGFPTANIPLHRKISEGIYASEVYIGNKVYRAATFVGKSETFHEYEYKSESYLLDFSGNLYGKWIRVKLHKKIRDNKRFSSAEDLIKQMHKDISQVRQFFNS